MNQEDKEHIISRIIQLQLEEVQRIGKGIKPTIDDDFSEKRKELELLRCIFFGYSSDFCILRKKKV